MIPIIIGNIAASAIDAISHATHSHGPATKDRFDDMLSQLQQTQSGGLGANQNDASSSRTADPIDK